MLHMDFVIRPLGGRHQPNADVFVDEERGQVVVCVELAGAQPDTLRIGVDERHLLVRGRRIEPVRFLRGSFVQKEISFGEFSKQIALPVAVEYAEATATYEDGVLVVVLPVALTAYHPTSLTEIRLVVKRTLA